MSTLVDFNKRWGENILRRFIRKYQIADYEGLLTELGRHEDEEIFPAVFIRKTETGHQFVGVHRHAQNN